MNKRTKFYKRKKKNVVLNILGTKLKNNGLVLALAFISLLGFMSQIIFLLFKIDIFGTFAYSSLILGIGLMAESQLFKVLNKRSNKLTNYVLTKMITALVGATVALGGLITLPFLGIEIVGSLKSIVVIANLIALVVILYEIFWVE